MPTSKLHARAGCSLLLAVAMSACGRDPEGPSPSHGESGAPKAPAPALTPSADEADAPRDAVNAPGVPETIEAAAPRPPPKVRPHVGAAVDQIFGDYVGAGTPGAAVMVIEDGQPTLVKTYGYARLEGAVPVSANTNFRLASVSKQFTAMAILMLVERGQLGLDDSIRGHFPELPEFAQDITIRQILQHTSGLRDYGPLVTEVFPAQISDEDVLELMCETDDTYFVPGTKYRYSNSGYAVLAMLVEKQSGQSFAAFLADNIFEPLDMHGTVAYERGVSTVENRALGYVVSGERVTNSDQNPYSAVLGDGGVYSSVNDLLEWDQALYTDKLIGPELRRQAFTPGLQGYGFGWRIDRYEGHRRLYHGGATCGFRTFYQRFVDERLSVIVLTNRAKPGVMSLAQEVADLYLASSARSMAPP